MRDDNKDLAAVAKAFAIQIRNERAKKLQVTLEPGVAVRPDGNFRAYVLDSIRHPAEVQLLRHIYQDAFVLIGVVCESDTRTERLREKYPEAGSVQVDEFMKRDEKAPEPHGQKVSDAFHLADFFIDNTPSRKNADGGPNRAWEVADKLSRLVKIIRQGDDVVRPEANETAMWHAYGASMRSACMSRQVGAALLDHVLQEARRRKANAAFLEVRSANHAAQALYEKSGFRAIARRANYYSDPREDAVVMTLNLG